MPPQQMFLHLTAQYSKFDPETGIPSHDLTGEPISASALKKLKKEWEKQKEAHDKYLERAAK